MRDPPWTRNGLISALDLFFRHKPMQMIQDHLELVALTQVLSTLLDAGRFHNHNGVCMKLRNFPRFDQNYRAAGLTRGGKLEGVLGRRH